MFERNDFENLVCIEGDRLKFLSAYRGLYYVYFPQYAFKVSDSEESIRITRAPKNSEDNGLRFWLSAELADDWQGRENHLLPYLSGGYFEQINEAAFIKLVAEKIAGLINPPELPLISEQAFVGALLMYSMKTEFIVSVFAEYEREYIHFAWETTA